MALRGRLVHASAGLQRGVTHDDAPGRIWLARLVDERWTQRRQCLWFVDWRPRSPDTRSDRSTGFRPDVAPTGCTFIFALRMDEHPMSGHPF